MHASILDSCSNERLFTAQPTPAMAPTNQRLGRLWGDRSTIDTICS